MHENCWTRPFVFNVKATESNRLRLCQGFQRANAFISGKFYYIVIMIYLLSYPYLCMWNMSLYDSNKSTGSIFQIWHFILNFAYHINLGTISVLVNLRLLVLANICILQLSLYTFDILTRQISMQYFLTSVFLLLHKINAKKIYIKKIKIKISI